MSSFSVQALRDKFSRLSGSQESIETLSLWIIHHKADAATTVSVWFEDIKSSRKFVGCFKATRVSHLAGGVRCVILPLALLVCTECVAVQRLSVIVPLNVLWLSTLYMQCV